MIWGYLLAIGLNVAATLLVGIGVPALFAQQDWLSLVVVAGLTSINGVFFYVNICGLRREWRRRRMRDMPAAPFDVSVVAAERQATAMLREVLTAEEWKELRSSGYLTVRSTNVPGRKYRIPAHTGVVKVYDNERLEMYLCAQPVKYLPTGDIVLMHKLHIQADEDHYLKVANRWYARPNVLSVAGDRWRS